MIFEKIRTHDILKYFFKISILKKLQKKVCKEKMSSMSWKFQKLWSKSWVSIIDEITIIAQKIILFLTYNSRDIHTCDFAIHQLFHMFHQVPINLINFYNSKYLRN